MDDKKQLFFGNMSERAAKIMEEGMQGRARCEKKEVSEARSSVMDTAKSLSESGELVLPGGGEDDELMY